MKLTLEHKGQSVALSVDTNEDTLLDGFEHLVNRMRPLVERVLSELSYTDQEVILSDGKLGEKLRQRRVDNGKTQGEVGCAIGKTKQMISFYEADRNRPPYEVLAKLAKYYGLSVSELVG